MNRDRWLGIERRHLAALEAIAEARSFCGAAGRLGYGQSAISRQVAQLEQIVGTRLIERGRGPRPTELTQAGEIVLGHARELLASIDATRAILSDIVGRRDGDVSVGVFPGVPTRVLPRALAAFGRCCPSARVMAFEAATDGPLLELVRQGSIDLAFAILPLEPGPFDSVEILRVPWVLVLPAGSGLATKATSPTVEEIVCLPLIAMKQRDSEHAPEASLTSGGERAHVVLRCDTVETAQALVGSGLGAAILPRLAIDEHDPRVSIAGLGEGLPPLSLGIVWRSRRSLSLPVVRFREAAEAACGALSAP